MSAEKDDSAQEDAIETPKPSAPTGTASSFVRYVLGFGVWVALGLAPFLGRVRIPGFAPLLDLYPVSLQGWLIPVSGFLMGAIALVIEYAAGQRLVLKTARKWFKRSIGVLLGALLVLVMVYDFLVTRVPVADGKRYIAVVTGPSLPTPIPEGCGCRPGMTNAQCVEEVTVNPTNVAACFGSVQVGLSGRALALLYLLLTASFASSAGILVLLKRDRDAKARRARKK